MRCPDYIITIVANYIGIAPGGSTTATPDGQSFLVLVEDGSACAAAGLNDYLSMPVREADRKGARDRTASLTQL